MSLSSQVEDPPTTRREDIVESGPGWLRRHLGDVLGLAIIVFAVFCFLSPALKDGPSFGPADLGRGLSQLTNLVNPAPNHNVINGDVITQGVSWNTLDWQLVHHGEVPLWNGLSGTGMPQLLNFESAPFALPTIAGYAFPLSLAFLVTVAMKVLIAGTGAYVLARLIGARPVAATFGGLTFMLSGAFTAHLGWSISGPYAWTGWIVAGILLTYRHRRLRDVALLALVVAFAIYGGFPEDYALMLGALIVLFGVGGIVLVATRRTLDVRGLGAAVLGCVAGLGLSAPLWFAGLSLISASARSGKVAATGLPIQTIAFSLAQGYDGLPYGTKTLPPPPQGLYFGPSNYFETAAYVGVIAAVLAIVAVVLAWRRPAVVGLLATVIFSFALVYQFGASAPIQHLVVHLGLASLALTRMLTLAAFALALLGALGLEVVLRRWHEPSVQGALLGAAALVAVVLVVAWFHTGGLSASDAALRHRALWWPLALVVVVLVGGVALVMAARRGGGRRFTLAMAFAAVLVAGQGAFLVFAGVGINSYSGNEFPVTPAVAQLRGVVGSKLVGLDGDNTVCPNPNGQPFCGLRFWTGIGLYPVMNLGYGVDELAMHDPLIPQSYFEAWPVPNEEQQTAVNLNLFAPALTSVALARRYGVSYVLVAKNVTPPIGMRFITAMSTADPNDGVRLYAVPGVSRFTLAHGSAIMPLPWTHPGNATYRVTVGGGAGGQLVARITDVAGWHAEADGRPLALTKAPGDLLAVQVPARTRTVTFTYAPRRLTEGEIAALVVIGCFLVAALAEMWRRRRRADASPHETPLVASTGG